MIILSQNAIYLYATFSATQTLSERLTQSLTAFIPFLSINVLNWGLIMNLFIVST